MMFRIQATLFGSIFLLQEEAILVVCAVSRNHVKSMLPLTITSKEATLSVTGMTADTQLRKRDPERLL